MNSDYEDPVLPASRSALPGLTIVGTPIGNLQDISDRAKEALATVDLIAAEDTRRVRQLLNHLGIHNRLTTYHDHNEAQQASVLVEQMAQGKHVALVSDAGMPTISDPGYQLVKLAHDKGVKVEVVPGPSALVTALSGSGLPSDRFMFVGFAPAKTVARSRFYADLRRHACTLICYESSHRIQASLGDLIEAYGPRQLICVARELTKQFETWLHGTAAEVKEQIDNDANQRKGEFVIVIGKPDQGLEGQDLDIERYMSLLTKKLPIKEAAAITSELLGVKKNRCYQIGLAKR